MILTLTASLLAVEPTAAPRVEPIIGLSSKLMLRSMTVKRGDSMERDYALTHKPIGLFGGVQWYWNRDHSFDTGGLRTSAALGVELCHRSARPH